MKRVLLLFLVLTSSAIAQTKPRQADFTLVLVHD
jgi:hypothetical protein